MVVKQGDAVIHGFAGMRRVVLVPMGAFVAVDTRRFFVGEGDYAMRILLNPPPCALACSLKYNALTRAPKPDKQCAQCSL